MERRKINLSNLRLNNGQIEGVPKNPRFIKDERFEKLKTSIQDDPEMLELREILVYPLDDAFVVIGGNMRLRAMRELGFSEAWCKVIPKDTTPDHIRAIVMKDNESYGNTDWEMVANEWDEVELEQWGIEIPMFELEEEEEEEKEDNEGPKLSIALKFDTTEDLEAAKDELKEVATRYNAKLK